MTQRMGGRSPIRVYLVGSTDVASLFDSILDQLMHDRFSGQFEFEVRTIGLDEAQSADLADVDLLLISIATVLDHQPSGIYDIVKAIKSRSDAHVAVFNASSLDPNEQLLNYARGEITSVERIRRLNLELLRASMDFGVSIVDVDRVLAEIGAREHVRGALQYSDDALEIIGAELIRVTEDIGFYEKRPLLAQVGRLGQTS